MWEVEGAEAALMEGLSVLASACEPSRDGGLTVAENPFSGGGVQPFGEGRQHDGDLLGRSFQAIERCVASSTEGGTTSLTAKRLDALGTAMRAIAYERMHVSSCDPAVSALRASTGIPFGVDADGVLLGDVSPRSMAAPEQAPVLQPTRAWRRDDRQGSRLGSGA